MRRKLSKKEIEKYYSWQEGDTTYEWYGNGMLKFIRLPNGKVVSFEYDALGRRTTKIRVWGRSIFHRVTRFLWDGDVPLHEWTYEGSESSKTKLTKEGYHYYPQGEPQTELTTIYFTPRPQ